MAGVSSFFMQRNEVMEQMDEQEIKELQCFEEITPYLENDLKENDVIEIALVETRLHYKKGRKYKVERFNSPEEVAQLGHKLLPRYLDREMIFVVGMTAKCEPIAVHLLSIGSMSAAIMEPARLLSFLLVSGSHSFVLYHNHVSGDTTPSEEDIMSTKRIKEASKLVGLKMVDHLIIGNGYTSMREEGYL